MRFSYIMYWFETVYLFIYFCFFILFEGLTPLHYASINGYLQVVKWLIEDLDASPMVTSKKGRTPRVYAKKHGHNKVALFLGEIGRYDNNNNN